MIYIVETIELIDNIPRVFNRDRNRIEADSWDEAEDMLKQKRLPYPAKIYGQYDDEIEISEDSLLDIMIAEMEKEAT